MAHRFTPGGDPTRVLGRRFVAYAIDVMLLVAVAVILLSIAPHTRYFDAPSYACRRLPNPGNVTCFRIGSHAYVWNRTDFLRVPIVTALVAFLDLVVVESFAGGSIGKLFVGLRVVDRNGVKADFLRNFGRWVLLAVDGGCFLIGLVSVLATHPHRRVGDFAAGTFVVAASSVGEPVTAAGQPARISESAASWPPAVTIPDSQIPTVPTPAPTSLWSPTDVAPPPAQSPQWTTPPVGTPNSPPPPPPTIEVSPPAQTEVHAPAIPAPWATPPEPSRGAETPASAPTLPATVPPAPEPPRVTIPPPAARPDSRPLESEPAPVRVTPAPVAAKVPPKPTRAATTSPTAPPAEPKPVGQPAPARPAPAPRRVASKAAPVEPPEAKPAPVANIDPPAPKAPPAPAPTRWAPVPPTAAPDAAPEAVADEWFELALSSDVPDDEPGEQ
jgi:uncharacterized RDD family membrane protein YckC